jgi:hypothetical protein
MNDDNNRAEEGDWVINLPADPLADAEVVLMGETIVVPPLWETLEGPTSTYVPTHHSHTSMSMDSHSMFVVFDVQPNGLPHIRRNTSREGNHR